MNRGISGSSPDRDNVFPVEPRIWEKQARGVGPSHSIPAILPAEESFVMLVPFQGGGDEPKGSTPRAKLFVFDGKNREIRDTIGNRSDRKNG